MPRVVGGNRPDAVVVGTGPNGLAAATVLTAAGLSVRVYEAADQIGGGCRTDELTLPGFRHDVCAAVHPLALASSFFTRFGLEARGVQFLQPEIPLAHPLGGRRAVVVQRSVEETAAALSREDGQAYRRLVGPLAGRPGALASAVLSSHRGMPRATLTAVRFAGLGVRSAMALARRFEGPAPRALLAGMGAHGNQPLDRPLTGGVALLLTSLAHEVGWPVVQGGSAGIVAALGTFLAERGTEVVTGQPVTSLGELPAARATLLDVGPHGFLAIAQDQLPARYAAQLRTFRYGPGVCKVDWALCGPVPWASAACRRAGTLHVGGTLEEIAACEFEVAHGRHPEWPFVLAVQPGVVDPTRAPVGTHTLWTYCHVPAGSDRDMSARIAAQIERFAPGFRELVLARSVRTARRVQAENANNVGGAIGGGVQDLRQTLLRPTPRWNPYRTPLPGVYLCSASTPPGPGVHGRCGELAAMSALHDRFGIRSADVDGDRRTWIMHRL